jgi:hypothetical protein
MKMEKKAELPYEQWIIVARDLINKEVEILRSPYQYQRGNVVDIWADGNNPRTINAELLSDGTYIPMLEPDEYKKI